VKELIDVVSFEAMPYLPKSDLEITDEEMGIIDLRLNEIKASLGNYGIETYNESFEMAGERFHCHRNAYPERQARLDGATQKAETVIGNLERYAHGESQVLQWHAGAQSIFQGGTVPLEQFDVVKFRMPPPRTLTSQWVPVILISDSTIFPTGGEGWDSRKERYLHHLRVHLDAVNGGMVRPYYAEGRQAVARIIESQPRVGEEMLRRTHDNTSIYPWTCVLAYGCPEFHGPGGEYSELTTENCERAMANVKELVNLAGQKYGTVILILPAHSRYFGPNAVLDRYMKEIAGVLRTHGAVVLRATPLWKALQNSVRANPDRKMGGPVAEQMAATYAALVIRLANVLVWDTMGKHYFQNDYGYGLRWIHVIDADNEELWNSAEKPLGFDHPLDQNLNPDSVDLFRTRVPLLRDHLDAPVDDSDIEIIIDDPYEQRGKAKSAMPKPPPDSRWRKSGPPQPPPTKPAPPTRGGPTGTPQPPPPKRGGAEEEASREQRPARDGNAPA
ncbi:MAG: hypothetical protein L6R35_007390, partial [Caloplaca aegaea]